MSNKNTTRRGFLQKVGVTVAAATVIDKEAYADINLNRFSSEQDRLNFLETYKIWVNEYIEVVESEKLNHDNIANKHKIMELSAQADSWRHQIIEYLEHEDFKEKYVTLSNKFADSITPELEA